MQVELVWEWTYHPLIRAVFWFLLLASQVSFSIIYDINHALRYVSHYKLFAMINTFNKPKAKFIIS